MVTAWDSLERPIAPVQANLEAMIHATFDGRDLDRRARKVDCDVRPPRQHVIVLVEP